MLNILDTIQDWIKGILRDCIMGNLNGLFDQINEQVGDVAAVSYTHLTLPTNSRV